MYNPVQFPLYPIWEPFVLVACEVNYHILDRPHKQFAKVSLLYSYVSTRMSAYLSPCCIPGPVSLFMMNLSASEGFTLLQILCKGCSFLRVLLRELYDHDA